VKRADFSVLTELNYFLQFLVMLAITVLSCSKVTIQGRVSRKYIQNTSDTVLFNVQLFAAIAAVVAILFNVSAPDLTLMLHAVICAVCTTVFQTAYAMALREGPVSLTVLIVNFHVLVTTAASIIMFGDPIFLTQILGIIALVISLLLSRSSSSDEKKVSGKWVMLIIVSIVSVSLFTIVQKLYATTDSNIENSDTTFICFMYISASIFSAIVFTLRSCLGKKEKSTYLFKKTNLNVLLYAVLTGLSLGIHQRFYMIGLANISGTLMFPTTAGLQSLIMTFIGIVLFRDKLSRRQMVGVVFGILCVALMNLRIGISL